MRDIALIGRARSGKDTIAARLVQEYGYTRVSFADPLKDMALEIDPIITSVAGEPMRLRYLVERVGWEHAKDAHPEVRRILQHVGQTVRKYDPDFWLRLARRCMMQIDGPTVVTDVRYPNEAAMLRRYGYRMVHVNRPGLAPVSPTDHESERLLTEYPADVFLRNGSTIAVLHQAVDRLVL